jgi:DNA replication protein DnaC
MLSPTEVKTRLNQNLKHLHMLAVRDCYEELAEMARRESMSHEHYLFEVTEREVESRRQNRIARMLRESKLPLEKSWESFDRKRLPRKVNTQLGTLLEGSFVDRNENILAFGNPGSGKTHLLCAIGQELIYRGRRVLFTTCSLLVQELLVAKRDLKLARVLKRLSKFSPLIIDDLGYVQQGREEMEVLFTLLAERYERGSVMITSNLPFSQWEKIFKDPMTTAAAIDRLVHHSIILELNVPSYRLEQSKKKKSQAIPKQGKESRMPPALASMAQERTSRCLPYPSYPPGDWGGVAGRARFRAPASGSGKEASLLSLVFRSRKQEPGTRRNSCPDETGFSTKEVTGVLIVVDGNNS